MRKQLKKQLYPHWELIVGKENLKQARGEWIAFIEPNVRLKKDALYQIVKVLNEDASIEMVYADNDERNCFGIPKNPRFKPDWDPYLFMSWDYMAGFSLIKKDCLEIPITARVIKHIPRILYSYSLNLETPRIAFDLPAQPPLVSILIPTKDGLSLLKPCIDSIFKTTKLQDFEILIINNNGEKSETFSYFKEIQSEQVRILDYPYAYNYSAINNFAAKQAKGEVLLLLNNDTEAISDGWLGEMLSLLLQPDVGAVGAKLYYPNETIQHAGVALFEKGPMHLFLGFKRKATGYCDLLQRIHSVSGVTGACLMIRKSLYEQIGGLDEKLLPIAFNDIDLCLEVWKVGCRVLWTPHAELYHKESATRGYEDTPEKIERFQKELGKFKEKWGVCAVYDPYYNPNLTQEFSDCSLALNINTILSPSL